MAGTTGDSDETGSSGAPASFFEPGERGVIIGWFGPIPETLPADQTNAFSQVPEAQTLGRALFFDGRVSADDTACATCHAPTAGFDDPMDGPRSRVAMSLFNGTFPASDSILAQWQGWDGGADSPWAQALRCAEAHTQMDSTRAAIALLVAQEYSADYEAVFGDLPELFDGNGDPLVSGETEAGSEAWDAIPQADRDAVTEVYVNFGKAIGAYLQQLVSRNSRFDAFREALEAGAEDSQLLDDVEKEGLRLFIGRGRCLGCHRGPNFTDGQFHNIGVPEVGGPDQGRRAGLEYLQSSEFGCDSQWSDHPDKSQCANGSLSPDDGEVGAFKTPSLRSLSTRAPYMHTGGFETLEDVVLHYDQGGAPSSEFSGPRDELIRLLQLTAEERVALAAFLETLEGEALPEMLTSAP